MRDLEAVLEVGASAANRSTKRDVIQRLASCRVVEPRVDEAHSWLSSSEAGIVEKSDNRGDNGSSCRCAAARLGSTVDDG